MPTSDRIVVAAMQVSPPKHGSLFSPSFANSATFIVRGKRSHITTSSEDVVAVVPVFLDLVDLAEVFLLLFLVGIFEVTPFDDRL